MTSYTIEKRLAYAIYDIDKQSNNVLWLAVYLNKWTYDIIYHWKILSIWLHINIDKTIQHRSLIGCLYK